MAELHVQTKKRNNGSLWIWILVALVIIAVVVYFFARNKNTNTTTTSNATTYPTSYTVLPQHHISSNTYVLNAI